MTRPAPAARSTEQDLRSTVAVITGAAGGIGAATARLLAQSGAAVALLDLPGSNGLFVQREISAAGGRAVFVPVDVTNESQVEDAAERVSGALGEANALVNVAGINRYARMEDLKADDWDAVMAVNVKGMFLTIKHFVPHLRAAGGGAVVNLSSVSAYVGADGYAAYHASKGAVLSLTRALALELATDGVRVNAVCPGWVDTPFSDEVFGRTRDPEALRLQAEKAQALGRMATPDDVARAIRFLISRDAAFVTGAPLFVDGGFMVKK